MATLPVTVEFATSDGLARYTITDDDLTAVPAEHQAHVRSALAALPVPPVSVAPEPEDSQADDGAPAVDDTPATTRGRGKKE
jgi:hypothetical protein